MQITKIKNKQTGEVYDIGGNNKLKLVAEGQFENDEATINGKYLEDGKMYLFCMSNSMQDLAQSVVFYVLDGGSEFLIHSYESGGDSQTISEILIQNREWNGSILVTIKPLYNPNYQIQGLELYQESFKIYELPFSL